MQVGIIMDRGVVLEGESGAEGSTIGLVMGAWTGVTIAECAKVSGGPTASVGEEALLASVATGMTSDNWGE